MAEDEEAEILVGTYEDYVVGYQLHAVSTSKKRPAKEKQNGDSETTNNTTKSKVINYSLEQSFAVRGHSGSVRCLAASQDGTLAMSAGFDEMINLFGLKKRKLLQTTEGAINCALFVENTHLIYGAEDGNIYIHECKGSTTTLVKTLQGHKGPVTALSVHPTGKVLLSLSKDNTMKTWNLIKGRSAFTTAMKPQPQVHLVKWSKSGEEFVIAANNEVYLYNNSGSLEHIIKLDKRINSIEFITDEVFVVASDSGILEFLNLKKGVSLMKHEAHDARIKSVEVLQLHALDQQQQSNFIFATASSDGLVKVWTVDKPGVDTPVELTRVDTGARLTCLTSVIRR